MVNIFKSSNPGEGNLNGPRPSPKSLKSRFLRTAYRLAGLAVALYSLVYLESTWEQEVIKAQKVTKAQQKLEVARLEAQAIEQHI